MPVAERLRAELAARHHEDRDTRHQRLGGGESAVEIAARESEEELVERVVRRRLECFARVADAYARRALVAAGRSLMLRTVSRCSHENPAWLKRYVATSVHTVMTRA